ncbi:hypothetical protein [Niabella aquatica]
METRQDIFQVIADPTRQAINTLIALQAMTPNATAEHFDTTGKPYLTFTHFYGMRTNQTGT